MFNRGGKEDQRNSRGNEKRGKETGGQNAAFKNGAAIAGAVMTAATAATTATVLSTKVYADSGRKIEKECKELVRQAMINQAYEVLSNSNIDEKIKKKAKEIESLRQKLAEIKNSEKTRKQKAEKICETLSLQIQNKSYCLDFLKKQKEKQESISQYMSKYENLIAEKGNTSFLHPVKKSGITKEIAIYEECVSNALDEFNDLERQISANEEKEDILAETIKRRTIARKSIKIVIAAVVIIGLCLVCGFIVW